MAESFDSDLDVLHVVPEEAKAGNEGEQQTAFRLGMGQLVPERVRAHLRSRTFVESGCAPQKLHPVRNHHRCTHLRLRVIGDPGEHVEITVAIIQPDGTLL